MEEEAAGAYQKVSKEADQENGIVSMFAAGLNAEKGEVGEEEVCEGVDNLGRVVGRIVFLEFCQLNVQDIDTGRKQTSSHQFMVEVTGSQ